MKGIDAFAQIAQAFVVFVAAAVAATRGGGIPRGEIIMHLRRLWSHVTGRLPNAAEAARMLWKSLVGAVLLAVAVCACQEPKPADPSLVGGIGNVHVLEAG